jgi:hypothetical protein
VLTRVKVAYLPATLLLAAGVACGNDAELTGTSPMAPQLDRKQEAVVPAPLVPIWIDGSAVEIWPYTDARLAGTPSDPINLIFVGQGNALNVRAALMSLDGNRDGPLAPFGCTWTDAIGGVQGAYTDGSGWSGSVIQLECGSYNPFRFHVRLFPNGSWTLANGHVDVLIPGTHDHQVLAWELAEQLVTYDIARSGLLAAAPAQTGVISAAPTFREIPPQIYNGLPVELRALTGGPLFGPVATGVGIVTDGSATILALQTAPAAPGSSQVVDIMFGQVVPKPYCNPAGAFIRVDGPITLRQDVTVTPGGILSSQTMANGDLIVRTFDLSTGALGPPAQARVRDHYRTQLNRSTHSVLSSRHQQLSTDGAPQQLLEDMRVGPAGPATFRSTEKCG